jgi:hypothetical protein
MGAVHRIAPDEADPDWQSVTFLNRLLARCSLGCVFTVLSVLRCVAGFLNPLHHGFQSRRISSDLRIASSGRFMSASICALVNSDMGSRGAAPADAGNVPSPSPAACRFGQSMPVEPYDDRFTALTVTGLGGLFGSAFSCVQTFPHSGQR